MSLGVLEIIICILLGALAISALFRRYHLPVVLGYLLVGTFVGPHALGFIPETKHIEEVAEFGIVFLMFTVGLEFSKPQLFALKRPAFVLGGSQVALTLFLTLSLTMMLGWTLLSGLVLASIIAMSSTAIVVKQLKDQNELHTSHGLNSVGILLFQDMAVIPLIILLAGLAHASQTSLMTEFIWSFLKGFIAIFIISTIGNWFLSYLFRQISKTKTEELFTLTVLLITLSASWLTNILGLSYAFGAFLAGICLSETEFRHRIEVEIRPFRDILLGLFFVSTGMLANVRSWPHIWLPILILLLSLTLGKMLLTMTICRLAGNNKPTALRTGIIVGQGSEFGFAILSLALSRHMIHPEYGQIILGALLLSMTVSPLFIFFNKRFASYLFPNNKKTEGEDFISSLPLEMTHTMQDHIVIIGYGRVGQHIGRILSLVDIPYAAIDNDSEIVKNAKLAGENVIYGDASHPGTLALLGFDAAKALIICVDDISNTIDILDMLQQKIRKMTTIVRCREYIELLELKKYFPTIVIAEIFEESLSIARHLLQGIHFPSDKISEVLNQVRENDYEMMHRVYAHSQAALSDVKFPASTQAIKSFVIKENSPAVGKKLRDLSLSEHVEIIAIRRKDTKSLTKPKLGTKIYASDILLLYGSDEGLNALEIELLGHMK
jgi:CPA2 family monovalent cation:H+ antiporter-2